MCCLEFAALVTALSPSLAPPVGPWQCFFPLSETPGFCVTERLLPIRAAYTPAPTARVCPWKDPLYGITAGSPPVKYNSGMRILGSFTHTVLGHCLPSIVFVMRYLLPHTHLSAVSAFLLTHGPTVCLPYHSKHSLQMGVLSSVADSTRPGMRRC